MCSPSAASRRTVIVMLALQTILAILTFLLACLVGLVSYQQWRATKVKFRLEMYAKRIAVYNAVMSFIETITAEGRSPNAEELQDLLKASRESRFLFGDDVFRYVTSLHAKALEMRTAGIQAQHEMHDKARKEQLYQQEADGLKWFADSSEQVFQVFKSHLFVGAMPTLLDLKEN